MDSTGDIYRIASLRRSGSSWRTPVDEVFSRSSRDEDDEEALKWATLEKLPTYDRIRKGILSDVGGEYREVDIPNLGYEEKKSLVDRLIRIADEDNERFLLKLKNRIERVGIDVPTIEVRYEHLIVDAEVHVGGRSVPNFINFSINVFEMLFSFLHVLPNRKKPLSILHDVSGIMRPRRMTLLLGPPSSGKTTLLLALAGKLDKDLKVSGQITYNGHGMEEFVPKKTSAYISQHDLHIPEMTVRETLAFSARCQGVGTRYEMLTELSRREKAANIVPDPDIDVFMKAAFLEGQETNIVTYYILKILGLDICADILVGDEMIRGISGGQRKRVTTGEMLVGPARVLFMDEISTGLDSSTTFHIVNSLRQSTHILGGTTIISLLQPPPETYDLFDDIILLSDGGIVYQGPRENVLEFFESMGFRCPERKGVADFLQEVTSRKDQGQYWARNDQPHKFVPISEFAEAFKSFHIGQRLADELRNPFNKSKSHPAALATSKYGVGNKELLKANFSREILLMKRNVFVYLFKIGLLTLLAFITMTVFLRTELKRETIDDGGLYLGAMFFGLTRIMFNGFSELPLTVMKLPVFYKQRDLLFFPPWTYSLPICITKIPVTFIEVGIWVFMTYYVIGFDPNVGRFFRQYILLLAVSQMASAIFRFLAAVSRNMLVANSIGSFAMLTILVLGGFIISRDEVKPWWIWGYWISPMMYGQNAIAANEFFGRSWRHVPANSTTGESLGEAVMKARSIFPDAYWYWLGVGALLGFVFVYNVMFTVALGFFDPFGKSHDVLSEETLKEKHANRIGEITQPNSQGMVDANRIDALPVSTPEQTEYVANTNQNQRRGMVLPFSPLSLTFENIRYSVDMPQAMKDQGIPEDRLELLKGVSGAFRPGVLTALMGVSGAGKTTLLDVLAGRKTGGYIDGNIRISGYPKKQETFARVSGYCEQNDIHSPHVTVYESLVYSAWLRLPAEVDSASRKMFIEEVMELMELKSLRGSIVGLPGVDGLSTEQRKRLTIAVELVANPAIIFMDEPTSGLDARAAAIVMRTVRNTVDTGRTVVCTIHQPSIDIFEAFDELFLMKRGGYEMYVGPLGHNSCHLITYFEGINGVEKIKAGYNPATWMLEITTEEKEANLGVDFADIYKNSNLFQRNKALIEELRNPSPGVEDLSFPTDYSLSFLSQCLACLWKQHLSYWRNPLYTAMRFYFTTFVALLFGTVFWNLGSKKERSQDLFNAMGSMYAAVSFLGAVNASAVQPIVTVERTVFYRERAAGMYSPLPYAYAQALIEVPYVLAQALIYGIFVYAMIAFEWTATKFFWYLFFMFFTLLYSTYFGMMTVAFTPSQNLASVLSMTFQAIWTLFSGFMIPRPKIPVWWRWYYWASPNAWTLYGLVVSQYGDITTALGSSDDQTVKEFLHDYFGFKHDFLGVVALVVVCLAALFSSIFAFSIRFLNFQKR